MKDVKEYENYMVQQTDSRLFQAHQIRCSCNNDVEHALFELFLYDKGAVMAQCTICGNIIDLRLMRSKPNQEPETVDEEELRKRLRQELKHISVLKKKRKEVAKVSVMVFIRDKLREIHNKEKQE